jgi:hypothetical protein
MDGRRVTQSDLREVKDELTDDIKAVEKRTDAKLESLRVDITALASRGQVRLVSVSAFIGAVGTMITVIDLLSKGR